MGWVTRRGPRAAFAAALSLWLLAAAGCSTGSPDQRLTVNAGSDWKGTVNGKTVLLEEGILRYRERAVPIPPGSEEMTIEDVGGVLTVTVDGVEALRDPPRR